MLGPPLAASITATGGLAAFLHRPGLVSNRQDSSTATKALQDSIVYVLIARWSTLEHGQAQLHNQ